MKEIKDYLHLYLGCEVEMWNREGAYSCILNLDLLAKTQKSWKKIKPILRALSDMTEEESIEMEICGVWGRKSSDKWDDVCLTPETIRQLLSKHFDLFNLIPDLAIDKTALK